MKMANAIFLIVSALGLACYYLLEHWESKNQRKQWKKYEEREDLF